VLLESVGSAAGWSPGRGVGARQLNLVYLSSGTLNFCHAANNGGTFASKRSGDA
jgi:hypothetical protein